MLRAVATLVLAMGLVACGGNEEQLELISYVNKLKEFDARNREVLKHIEKLDDPSINVTAEDLQDVRDFVAEYISELEKIDPVEMQFRALRLAYTTHMRQVSQANELASDKGNDLRRERGNVAIGVRHIEKFTKLHFKAVDVLWLREKVQDPFPLAWPEDE
jgi:Asp-tRNA(Asn)/Glu-tRNA(Gln) amidotransferase C subunit